VLPDLETPPELISGLAEIVDRHERNVIDKVHAAAEAGHPELADQITQLMADVDCMRDFIKSISHLPVFDPLPHRLRARPGGVPTERNEAESE
jgi:hypothetical protein